MSPTPLSFHVLFPVPLSSIVSPKVKSFPRLANIIKTSTTPSITDVLLINNIFVFFVSLHFNCLQMNNRCKSRSGFFLLYQEELMLHKHFRVNLQQQVRCHRLHQLPPHLFPPYQSPPSLLLQKEDKDNTSIAMFY